MNYEPLYGYEPVQTHFEPEHTDFLYEPFKGLKNAYKKTRPLGFDIINRDIYDSRFRMNTVVHSYGGFINYDVSPVHEEDLTTPWSEQHQAEYAFFADYKRPVGYTHNHQGGNNRVDKQKVQKIAHQAEDTGIMPIIWFDVVRTPRTPRYFESGKNEWGNYYFLNIVMPLSRKNWHNKLWSSEDPWRFIYHLKKYPAYGYTSLPEQLPDAEGKMLPLSDLWGTVVDNYLAAKGLDAVEVAKEWDEQLLFSVSQRLEALVRGDLNPRSRKIRTELDKILVGEVVLPTRLITSGSKKRGYETIRRTETTREIAFFLSESEKIKLIEAWDTAVTKYVLGPSSQLNAKLALIKDKSYAMDERDIKEATSRNRLTNVPVFDTKGDVKFTTTAHSAALDKANLPDKFVLHDMPEALPGYYKEGEKLRRDMQYDFATNTPDIPGFGTGGEGRGGLMPWLIGGAAAAVAAYAATR